MKVTKGQPEEASEEVLARREKGRQNYQANKQAYKDRAERWKAANPDKVRESSRRRQARFRETLSYEAVKDSQLRRSYGISWEEYSRMFDSQEGTCKICKSALVLHSPKAGTNTANVDHCHTTGRVRGLLCNRCNQGIGYLQDSPELLRQAAEYLDAGV